LLREQPLDQRAQIEEIAFVALKIVPRQSAGFVGIHIYKYEFHDKPPRPKLQATLRFFDV
jgi:hypothetical protein